MIYFNDDGTFTDGLTSNHFRQLGFPFINSYGNIDIETFDIGEVDTDNLLRLCYQLQIPFVFYTSHTDFYIFNKEVKGTADVYLTSALIHNIMNDCDVEKIKMFVLMRNV